MIWSHDHKGMQWWSQYNHLMLVSCCRLWQSEFHLKYTTVTTPGSNLLIAGFCLVMAKSAKLWHRGERIRLCLWMCHGVVAPFCVMAFGKLTASLPVVSRLRLKISKHSKLWRVPCNSAWRRVGKWKSTVLFKVNGLGSAIFMLLSFQMEDLRYPVWFWFSSMWCGFKWHEGVKHVFAAVDCE